MSLGDREADVYELFELAKESRTHLLIRSIQNRKTREKINLWDLLEQEATLGEMIVQVPKSDKRKAREAILEIRVRKVDIVKPKSRKGEGDVGLWALLVSERNAPKGE